jgi:hypothetical protein
MKDGSKLLFLLSPDVLQNIHHLQYLDCMQQANAAIKRNSLDNKHV